MAKLTNVRERVHQPFRDSLIRTSGLYPSSIQDRTDLFTQAGKDDGQTNLKNGSTLPSDQSMVVLALRVFTWFRPGVDRRTSNNLATGTTVSNGDVFLNSSAGLPTVWAAGNGWGTTYDTYRLNWQAEEQLLWSFGSGEKFSLTSMPTAYFPYGGGLSGDMGGVTDDFINLGGDLAKPGAIHWQNGTPDHSGILRLARAVLLPPRQNVKVQAQIVQLPDGGNSAAFGTTQGSRNMLSLTSNLNALDGISKCIAFTFDGLFSRDVQ